MYNTPHCQITQIKEKNAILVKWKQKYSGDDYRNPFLYAMELVAKEQIDTWIVDTTTGFENEEADTKWLLEEFVPMMIESMIRRIIFIIAEDSPLHDEIEGQAMALREFFEVERLY
ncbi:MAG: hypothetical protein LGB67_05450 [Sulfurovum sp.]|nr:hypothetical protein [Sulfurovum sp.]MCB4784336.1 hypothetical protein [Sulfurovum sp.]